MCPAALLITSHQVIPRPTFDNDYLMAAYDTEGQLQPHKVACVFFVLALGVLMDVDVQSSASELLPVRHV